MEIEPQFLILAFLMLIIAFNLFHVIISFTEINKA